MSEQSEQVEQREPARQIERVAVVGAGYMGGGIAQVLALAGLHVTIVDAEPSLTRRHLDRLRRETEDFEARGLFDPGSAKRVRANPASRVPSSASSTAATVRALRRARWHRRRAVPRPSAHDPAGFAAVLDQIDPARAAP